MQCCVGVSASNFQAQTRKNGGARDLGNIVRCWLAHFVGGVVWAMERQKKKNAALAGGRLSRLSALFLLFSFLLALHSVRVYPVKRRFFIVSAFTFFLILNFCVPAANIASPRKAPVDKVCDFGSFAELEIVWATRRGNRSECKDPHILPWPWSVCLRSRPW